MPMTVLPKNSGYNPRGTRRYIWVPFSEMPDGVLDTAALTATATVDLTNQIVTSAGWTTTQAFVPDPDVGSLRTGTIEGEVTYAESSLTFRMSKTGPANDARAVLHEGDVGFLVTANEGLVAGRSADVARSRVAFGTKVNEDVARYLVPFSVNNIDHDVVIPALA